MNSPDTGPQAKIVDLFAGPGGLDMAAYALGIPAVGIEWDKNARATRDKAGLVTGGENVCDHGPSDFKDATVLVGGPPCQTFTVAGNGKGRRALDQVLSFARRMADGQDVRAELKDMDDERTGLVLEPLRWVLEALRIDGLNPYEVVVLEQVPAALLVWEEYGQILEKNGYSVDFDVLRTEEFGVPQTRKRAVLIARRLSEQERAAGVSVRLPTPTHHRFHKNQPPAILDGGREHWVSMGQVLSRTTPFEVVSNYGTGGDPSARGRRTSEEPAFTVTGKVSRNRVEYPKGVELDAKNPPRLTDKEAGLLQTFPGCFPWSGSNVAQQIGNAVPPRLGIHILAAAMGLPRDAAQKAIKELQNWTVPATTSSTSRLQN